MKSVCFTGHRNISENRVADLYEELTKLLERGVSKGITEYYAGGAIGWDTICEEVVLGLKKKYEGVHLHLILPCSNEEQVKKWTEIQKDKFYEILALADTVEYVSDYYYNGCMKLRNERLVELADVCLCYYNIADKRSGTGQTVRMAERKGLKVYNFYKA